MLTKTLLEIWTQEPVILMSDVLPDKTMELFQ